MTYGGKYELNRAISSITLNWMHPHHAGSRCAVCAMAVTFLQEWVKWYRVYRRIYCPLQAIKRAFFYSEAQMRNDPDDEINYVPSLQQSLDEAMACRQMDYDEALHRFAQVVKRGLSAPIKTDATHET